VADDSKTQAVEQPLENRSAAHSLFRTRYESADVSRYQGWCLAYESHPKSNRFQKITIDKLAAKALAANGISRSFGFIFIDHLQRAHPFKGRAHLQLLRWSLENA